MRRTSSWMTCGEFAFASSTAPGHGPSCHEPRRLAQSRRGFAARALIARSGCLLYDVEQMAAPPAIGQFEQLVMTAVLRCGGNAYGVTIHAAVEELSSSEKVALGAVYATLDRLEDKGLVTSWLSDPTPERGGRSKRHYRLESNGERALRESALAARRICDALEHEWGPNAWTGKWKPARPR